MKKNKQNPTYVSSMKREETSEHRIQNNGNPRRISKTQDQIRIQIKYYASYLNILKFLMFFSMLVPLTRASNYNLLKVKNCFLIPEFRNPSPESGVRNPKSRISSPQSQIPSLESRGAVLNPYSQTSVTPLALLFFPIAITFILLIEGRIVILLEIATSSVHSFSNTMAQTLQ